MDLNLDSPDSEFHSVISGPYGLQTRPGLVTAITADDLAWIIEGNALPRNVLAVPAKRIASAFTAQSANTGAVYNYVYAVYPGATGQGDKLYEFILDSEMVPRARKIICENFNDSDEPFSVAINYNQIVVNARSLPYPLWGFIGGSLIRAQPVDSINPDTPALTLFPGRVCTFADRFVWAFANQIIINDPGTEPRTICAPNGISFGGTVFDVFQAGSGGNLVVVCSDATYLLPPDGLAGYQWQGTVTRVPGYAGAKPAGAGSARGNVLGLTRDGVLDLASLATRKLNIYRQRRRLTEPVGPGGSGDYRTGTLISNEKEVAVSIEGRTCIIDVDSGMATWYYATAEWRATGGSDIDVIGLLRDEDGDSLYVTGDAIITMYGNTDYADTPSVFAPTPAALQPNGAIALNVPSSPELSPVVREITTGADRAGGVQSTYVRGSLQTAITPVPQRSVVIGTALWGAPETLVEREMRSRRMQRAVRSDSPDMEVLIGGGETRISPVVNLVTRGIGKDRPSN
jgi:hypothetical protein